MLFGVFSHYIMLWFAAHLICLKAQAYESSHCPFSELKNKVTPPCKTSSSIVLFTYLVEGCILKLYCHRYAFQSFRHNWTELPTAIQWNLGSLAKGLRVQSWCSLVSEKEAISEERHCDYIQKAIAKLDSLLLPLQYMETSHGQLGTSNLWTWT